MDRGFRVVASLQWYMPRCISRVSLPLCASTPAVLDLARTVYGSRLYNDSFVVQTSIIGFKELTLAKDVICLNGTQKRLLDMLSQARDGILIRVRYRSLI